MTEWKPLIYILVCKDPEETNTYVGKAGEGLFRYYTYLTDYYKGYHKVVEYIKSHGGWRNWKWIPVEYAQPDTTSKGVSYMERYWIDKLNPSLNVSKRPILWPWERRKRYKKKTRTLDLKDIG
jgi:hypothetical protein